MRLLGHVIPDNKNIWMGLCTVYGIGRSKSTTILTAVKISPSTKVKDLSDEQVKSILDEIKNHLVESDLKRETATSIKRLKEIKSYRGVRHNMGLPVRGQQTSKNAKTAKKLLGRAKVRPVLKK